MPSPPPSSFSTIATTAAAGSSTPSTPSTSSSSSSSSSPASPSPLPTATNPFLTARTPAPPSPHHHHHKPRTASGQRSAHLDVFKPNLPRDPFAVLPKQPVQVSAEAVFTLAAAGPARNVILALGSPSSDHLGPLLRSEQLAASLLILASHAPPDIPPGIYPAVRVLRLTTPLDLEQHGALRLVNVLEWAERVARAWRKHGGAGVVHIDERDTGVLAPPKIFRSRANSASSMRSAASASASLSHSQPASPHASQLVLPNASAASSTSILPSPSPSPNSRASAPPSSTLSKRASRVLPKPDPAQRPFDALVHCIGPDVADKDILKQAILVTTVSRTFLVASAPPPPSPSSSSSSSYNTLPTRRSIFRTSIASSSRESLAAPPPPPSRRAHLIHLLCSTARASPRVLASIESFLLSFSPHVHSPSHAELLRASTDPLASAPSRAFVLDTRTFGSALPVPPALGVPAAFSVADAIVGGCVDPPPPPTPSPSSLSTGAGAGGVGAEMMGMVQEQPTRPRAWIGSVADLAVVHLPGMGGDAAREPVRAHVRARTDGAVAVLQRQDQRQQQHPQQQYPFKYQQHSQQQHPLKQQYMLEHQLPTPPDSEEDADDQRELLGKRGVLAEPLVPALVQMHHGVAPMSRGGGGGGGGVNVSAQTVSDGPRGRRRRWMFWRRA